MSLPRGPASDRRSLVVFGCLGALLMSIVSCCLLGGLSVLPVFSGSVPAPPQADPARPDITIIVLESFIQRSLADALPENAADRATFDIQPGNRLVFGATVDLLLVDLDIRATLGLSVEGGQLRLRLISLDAGGQELTELFGGNLASLTDEMSRLMQEQIETGLGPGARLLAIETDEQRLIIKARWE